MPSNKSSTTNFKEQTDERFSTAKSIPNGEPDSPKTRFVTFKNRSDDTEEQATMRLHKMEAAARALLECCGEDVEREGLRDTPTRFAEALLFHTRGYQMNDADVVNGALFHNDYDTGMVVVKDIDFSSLCEHHLAPFSGKMYIGYIPHETIIGISKFSRIAEIYSRRLQVQERLTSEVANAVMSILKPHAVVVYMEASHTCMTTRGVEKPGAMTITYCVRGVHHVSEKNALLDRLLSIAGLKQ